MSDVAQMLMVLVVALILVPLALNAAGGISVLSEGLGGVSGEFRNCVARRSNLTDADAHNSLKV